MLSIFQGWLNACSGNLQELEANLTGNGSVTPKLLWGPLAAKWKGSSGLYSAGI